LEDFSHLCLRNGLSAQTFFYPSVAREKLITPSVFSCKEKTEISKCPKSFLKLKKGSYYTFLSCARASSRRPGLMLICNYSRQALGQTGFGHFCPIGGIHEKSNNVLIFDVARFKYNNY